MKLIITFLIFFLSINSYAQVDVVTDKWLIILSGFDNLEKAAEAQKSYDFKSQILNSSEYDNLNPGWFINVLTKESYNNAESESENLNQKGFKSYVKYSGKYKNTDLYLLDNHYTILGGKYMITDFEIDKEKISTIIGYDDDENGTYIAKAKIDSEELPSQLKYLVGKEFIVYDFNGNTTNAKINEFNAVNISIPYWGFVVQWKQENLSEIEIAKNLIDMGQLTIVAKLDLDNTIEGAIANLKTDYFFKWDGEYKNQENIDNAYQKLNTNYVIKECDSLLSKSMKEEDAYAYNKQLPIFRQAKELKSGDTTFVFLNVIYGDYCDSQKYGHFYSNIFAVWNNINDKIEIIEDFRELAQFNFSPFIVTGTDSQILGFIKKNYGGIGTYFKYPDWKNYKHLGIWAHECD